MCMPGDNIEMTIELIHPIAMSQGLTFAIREGGRTVGSERKIPRNRKVSGVFLLCKKFKIRL